MPNINAKVRLERIAAEMEKITQHVVLHSGVDAKSADFIEWRCQEIIQSAARIAQEARKAQGNQSYKTLVTKIRKALGFTYP